MQAAIRVAVIDDEQPVRIALVRLITSAGYQVNAFSSAGEFLDSLNLDFDCVLCDLRMPRIGGLELQQELKKTLPYLSVVFLSGVGDVPASVKAMKSGAVDFLEKPANEEELLAAICRASERSRALRAVASQLSDLRDHYFMLTPREREIFALITAGYLNKQTGFELGIAEKTVKVHRARVMEKMGAASLADLVRMAHKLRVNGHAEFPASPDAGGLESTIDPVIEPRASNREVCQADLPRAVANWRNPAWKRALCAMAESGVSSRRLKQSKLDR